MSYTNITKRNGDLHDHLTILRSLDKSTDVVETLEEMHGMIWFLAARFVGPRAKEAIDEAQQHYKDGLVIAKELTGGTN